MNKLSSSLIGFPAGTPIRTPDGPVPVEELQAGVIIQTRPDDTAESHEPKQHNDGQETDPRWWERN